MAIVVQREVVGLNDSRPRPGASRVNRFSAPVNCSHKRGIAELSDSEGCSAGNQAKHD